MDRPLGYWGAVMLMRHSGAVKAIASGMISASSTTRLFRMSGWPR